MAKERQQVIEDLKRGCRKSGSEYVSVRREDLLLALGDEPQQPVKAAPTDNGPRTTDKK